MHTASGTHPVQVILMGVTGVGKTTVGHLLAERLGARFVDADAFHPPANVEKMRAGTPLTDTDRWPWLDALNAHLREASVRGEPLVLACSALKAAYRERLRDGVAGLRFIHLTGSKDLIAERLGARVGHYMNPALLASQLSTLEWPDDAISLDIGETPVRLAELALAALRTGAVPGPGSRAPESAA